MPLMCGGRSDYEDFYVISKEATEQQIINAQEFIAAVEQYLNIML